MEEKGQSTKAYHKNALGPLVYLYALKYRIKYAES